MPAVEMRCISKRFGRVEALSSADLTVEPGTIHALVGENGAGKTTLMRVLYGAVQPDSGTVSLGGTQVTFSNSAQAIAEGIGMVSQHYSIIPDLTNLQNLMLGAEPGWLINRRAASKRAQELAERMGFVFSWNGPASELSPAGAQKLEILKLLWRNARIMILDEPTAMLSPSDSDALFESLKQLTSLGATVILVTHRLPEVIAHCDAVTVLRGGKVVGTGKVDSLNASRLAEMIVGHPLQKLSPNIRGIDPRVRLMLVGVSARGYRGDMALNDATLNLHEGELLGIAGVDGNGQRELFQVLTGELPSESGALTWDGAEITRASIAHRLAQGFRLIPEDRHAEGVIDDWRLEENAALGLQRSQPFAVGALIDAAGRREAAEQIADRFSTRHGGLDAPISSLSGGNQQRFVAGRALFRSPQLILAFQPARGLDIDATRRLFAVMREECQKGACAIVVSFDLDELLDNCDRILVMNGGRILEPMSGTRDRNVIGGLMVGAA